MRLIAIVFALFLIIMVAGAAELDTLRAPAAEPAIRVAIIGDIAIRNFPAQTAATVEEAARTYLPENGFAAGRAGTEQAYERMLFRGYEKLARWMKEGGNPLGPTFIIYQNDPRTTPPGELTCKIGYPASARANGRDSVKIEELPAMTAAVAHFTGPFRDSGLIWDSLAQWITAHGYLTAGPIMEVYLRGMRDSTHPEENFAEVRWPVRRIDLSTPPEQVVPASPRSR